MSKHHSEHYVLFCHDCFSHRHYEVVGKSLRKICHSERNVEINAYSHVAMDAYIFRFSRTGEREVDVNHNSDHSVIFCHDPLSQLAIDVSSYMKLMHARTDSPRFDGALRNKG